MALNPITWSAQRRDAGYYLVATSNLCEHDHFLQSVALRHDASHLDEIDVEALDAWCWSSGEETLVNLFLTCAGYSRAVTVRDILNLDSKNKSAAANTISMLCAPAEGWEF